MSLFDFFNEQEKKPQDDVTPSFVDVFKEAMDAKALDMRVSMPAEVIRYDHAKQLVDVKPFFKRKANDGQLIDPPVIYNVPVAFHRAGEAFITMPIAAGHSVLLVFADRSMEKWLSSGARGDPEDTRHHHISDAIAIPGCYPFSNAAPVHNAEDVIIKNQNIEFRIKPSGKVQILNGRFELLKVIDEWMRADISGAHPWKIAIRKKFITFLQS